jgi:PAS domain S-box-containing protein
MAMDAAKIGTFEWNMLTGQVYWSPNLESMVGLQPGGFKGNFAAFERMVYPEDREKVQHAIRSSLESRDDYEVEIRMIRPDGSLRWAQAKRRIFFDRVGKPSRMIGIAIDIAERKKAEDELVRSRADARAQAEDLAAILDAVPAMTFIAHDPACQTMTSSRAAHEILRVPYGSNTSKSAPAGEQPSHFQVLKDGRELSPDELPVQRAALTGQAVRDAELRIAFDDGTWRDIYGHAVPLTNEQGRVRGAVGAFVDITARKKAEEELKKSEARLRRFVDANLIGIFNSTPEHSFVQANDIFLNMLGYTREEFYSRNFDWRKITPPEYLARGEQAVEELKAAGTFAPFEKEYIRKDGTRIPILIGAAVMSQSPLEWMCFVLDLTERKRIDELRTRERIHQELLENEILAREEERRRIARELHDESGQMMASLLAGLRVIDDAKSLKEAKSQAQNLRKIASSAISELGRLSHGLHPLALDDHGLQIALKYYAKEYEKAHKIKVKLKISGLASKRLSRNTEAGLYRIAQEALTNISKHAKARTAEISLNVKDDLLDLKIADDGCGFDAESVMTNPSGQHLGLQGMRERASMLGGTLSVQSRRGGGTIKTLRIPATFR